MTIDRTSGDAAGCAAIRVLYSFPKPRPSTNPYVIQLIESVSARVEPSYFSWRSAFLSSYDVFHVHWPEWLLRGRKRAANVYKPLLFLMLLARLRIARIPIVRTLHNIQPHESVGFFGRQVQKVLDAQVVATVNLNEVNSGRINEVTILHGHYKNWYSPIVSEERGSNHTLLFIGMIRPYKGIEALIGAVIDSQDPSLTLLISGVPANETYASGLIESADGDRRIEFEFGYLDDSEFAERISRSELVVLPYSSMFNSGAMLAALSLDRPVLVPDTAVTRKMAEEIGSDWVLIFAGKLNSQSLNAARSQLIGAAERGEPDLSRRDWDNAGQCHVEVYEAAMRCTN